MKQKLLFLILPVILFTATLQAQDKVWDFGNDVTNFPVAAGFTDTQIRDGLTLVGGGSLYATVEANASTWPASPGGGYTSINRLKSEGSSSVSSGLPTRRYMQFSVTGPVSIKLWFRFSGTGTPRSVEVTDASGTVIMRLDSPGNTDTQYLEANYTGGAGTILVFTDNNAVNFYKLETSSALLGLNKNISPVSTNVQAIGNRIVVSNVKTNSEVKIYSITGALVKSFKTNNETDFTFKSGLYIATIKTNEGQKSVKLLLH
ncbi:T9SS type A sorting domain-containing protein [Mariniflexile aquimaris]|uniref:T9SS type A sorting domain-containing protein n=1 Tax=Mariniflexile aquimaris TaxID=881009 RepID=A0ABW3BU85_9FLAO